MTFHLIVRSAIEILKKKNQSFLQIMFQCNDESIQTQIELAEIAVEPLFVADLKELLEGFVFAVVFDLDLVGSLLMLALV